MDSGNSGSLQSNSSGGGGDEDDSLSALFLQSPPASAPSSAGAAVQRFYSLQEPSWGVSARPFFSSSQQPAPPATAASVSAAGPSTAAAPKGTRKRTRASRRAPTTVLTTDTTNFRAMVQEFTGIPSPPFAAGGPGGSGAAVRGRFDHLFPSPLLRVGATADAAGQPYLLRPFPHKPLPSPQLIPFGSPPQRPSSSSSPAIVTIAAGSTSKQQTVPSSAAAATTTTIAASSSITLPMSTGYSPPPSNIFLNLQDTNFFSFQSLLNSQLVAGAASGTGFDELANIVAGARPPSSDVGATTTTTTPTPTSSEPTTTSSAPAPTTTTTTSWLNQ